MYEDESKVHMHPYMSGKEDEVMVSTTNSTMGTTSLVEQMMLDFFDDIYNDAKGRKPTLEADDGVESKQGSTSESPVLGIHCPQHELMDVDQSTLLPSKLQIHPH